MSVLKFYHLSADHAPGKAAGETPLRNRDSDRVLRSIRDWRRLITCEGNHEPFEYDGHLYASVEHAWAGTFLIDNGFHDEARQYQWRMRTELSRTSGVTARQQLYKFKKRHSLIKVQKEVPDGRKRNFYYIGREWKSRADHEQLMMEILRAKFASGTLAHKALMATYPAQLQPAGNNMGNAFNHELQTLRDDLRDEELYGPLDDGNDDNEEGEEVPLKRQRK